MIQTINAIFCLAGHDDVNFVQIAHKFIRVLLPMLVELLMSCNEDSILVQDILKTISATAIIQKGASQGKIFLIRLPSC